MIVLPGVRIERLPRPLEHTGTLIVDDSKWSVTVVEDQPYVIALTQIAWVMDLETGQASFQASSPVDLITEVSARVPLLMAIRDKLTHALREES